MAEGRWTAGGALKFGFRVQGAGEAGERWTFWMMICFNIDLFSRQYASKILGTHEVTIKGKCGEQALLRVPDEGAEDGRKWITNPVTCRCLPDQQR